MTIYIPDCFIDPTYGDDDAIGTSADEAWATLAKASSVSLSPGDIVGLKNADTHRGTFIPPNAGANGNPIYLVGYGAGPKAIISGANVGAPTTPVRDYCIYDNQGRGYITVDGIELAYAAEQGIKHEKYVSGLEASTPNWIVKNNLFTKCGVNLFGPNTIVQDNTFVGPQPTGADKGALFIRGAVSENCIAQRNIISGYYGRGIWFMYTTPNPTANNNIIYDILFDYGTSNEGYGINFDGYGYIITGKVTAHNNTIYNCAANGIELENCSDDSELRYNLIHDCDRSGILYLNYAAYAERYTEQRGNNVSGEIAYNKIYRTRYGIELDGVSDVAIWNNVLYEGVGSYPKALSINDADGTMVDTIDFRNNIALSGFSQVVSVPHYAATWTKFFGAFDYNAIQADVIEERGAHWYSLTQVKAQGQAAHSFSTDPAFVNAGIYDFHLQAGSPCIDTGIDVGLTEDYDGVGVTDPPDIGAFQFYTEINMATIINLTGISSGNLATDPITVSAVADNPALFENFVVNYISPESMGSIELTPVVGTEGISEITVTVKNDKPINNTISKSFMVTVVKINSPTIDDIPDITVFS